MTNSLYSKCKRCGKEFSASTCPFCTVTGLDIEALLAEEGLSLRPPDNDGSSTPVALVDTVSGKSYPVVAPICKVGRDPSNDIALTGDRSLSRNHFQVRVWGDEYFVEDCGSRNGTFLNGSPISTPRKLSNGDVVSAGMTRYRFVLNLIGGGSARGNDDSDIDALMAPKVQAHPEPERVTVVAAAPAPEPAAPTPQAAADSDPEKVRLLEEKQRLLEMMEKMKRELEQLDSQITTPAAGAAPTTSAPAPAALKLEDVAASAREAFAALGWTIDFSAATQEEITLRRLGKIDAVVRVYCGSKEPMPNELEALINQQAVVWCQFSYEPKGILVLHLRDAGEKQSLSAELLDSVTRRKFSVITSQHIAAIIKRSKSGDLDSNKVVESLLSTNGDITV